MTSISVRIRAGTRERVHGAAEQTLADEVVEAAHDDGESQARGRKLPFEYS